MNLDFKLTGKEKVQNYPSKVTDKPLVSVCVQTYKHEKYIKQCLDGILMQRTNFEFEILLGEDDSPDKTREICIEYAYKYPDKIRLFLHDRSNVIYINGNPTGRYNFIHNLSNVNGKYIALCEGDDYWTDPLKLQKQVDFLEANKDYSLCFTNRVNLDIKTNSFVKSKQVKLFDFRFKDYLDKNKNGIVTATATSMFRANIMDKFNLEDFLEYSKKSMAADTFLFSICLTQGKGKILKDTTTVYRVTGKGASSKFTMPVRYKIRWTTYSFLLDKNLIKDDGDRLYVEKKFKKLKKNYYKNKTLNFTNKIGLNSVIKNILYKR